LKSPPFYLAASLVLGSYLCLASSTVTAADASSGYGQPRANDVLQRDPFTTSDKMYGEVGIQSAQKANAQQGFVPGYGAQSVPKMRVKGFVNRGAKRSVALLEIEGAGVYLVSEGEEIGLQALGQNTVIKILKVDANSVKVQSGQVNQVIIVR
jgi:hypothetical protein